MCRVRPAESRALEETRPYELTQITRAAQMEQGGPRVRLRNRDRYSSNSILILFVIMMPPRGSWSVTVMYALPTPGGA